MQRVQGRIAIRLRGSLEPFEHAGIYVELVGSIQRNSEKDQRLDFGSMRHCLVPQGESPLMDESTVLAFSFDAARFPFESYDGVAISLRYCVRVVIERRLADVVREATLWCARPPPGAADAGLEGGGGGGAVELDVGLEDFLHIKLHLDRSRFAFCDVVTGALQFILVRVRIIDVQIALTRKEIGATEGEVLDQVTLTTKQLLDGPAHRGDTIPVHLDLASIAPELTPTMSHVNRVFSLRYYVSVILRDAEGRKYYKQVEVHLFRPPAGAAIEPPLYGHALPSFKMGLVAI